MKYKLLFTFDDNKEYMTTLPFVYDEVNESLRDIYDHSTISIHDTMPIYINTAKLKMVSLIKDGEKDNG